MSLTHRLFFLVWLVSLLFVTACIMNNTIPELQKPDDPLVPSDITIKITDPPPNQELPPTSSVTLRVEIRGIDHHPAELSVLLNDSLFAEQEIRYGSTYHFQQSTQPGRWADPDSPLVVKALLTDAADSTFVDSVVTHLAPYFEEQPVIEEPANNFVFLQDPGSSIELEVESYSGRQSYTFCVANDSLFTDAECHSTQYAGYTFTPPATGYYYLRVKVIGLLGMESPWSDVHRFGVMNDISYSSEFQSLSQIDRVVEGSGSHYLLGKVGHLGAVMKCDSGMSKLWQRTFADASDVEPVDCDELADGSLYVALSKDDDYFDEDWICLLSSEGQVIWNRALENYTKISSIRATRDDMIICGFSVGGNPHVAKMDAAEQPSWEFGDGNSGSCMRLRDDREAGSYWYLLRGRAVSYTIGEIDLYGNGIWENSVNIAADNYEAAYVLTHLADGGFVLGSTVEPPSGYDYIYLAKVDAVGAVIWQSSLRFTDDAHWTMGAVKESADGSLVLAGTKSGSSSYAPSGAFLASIDSEGNPEWVQVFGSDISKEYGKDLAILADGIILFGYQYGSATNTPLAIRVDLNGNVLFD